MLRAQKQSSAPTLPVKAWSTPGLVGIAPPTDLDDVADEEVAALVTLRLRLERLHAWWLLGAMFLALLSVLVVGAVVDSRFVFGAWATAVATGVVWLGAVTPWAQRAVFLRQATACGLSADVADQLFVAAVDAAHWVSVLETCGHRPSQAELASFVRRESVADG